MAYADCGTYGKLDDYFAHYKRAVWLAQAPTLALEAEAQRIATTSSPSPLPQSPPASPAWSPPWPTSSKVLALCPTGPIELALCPTGPIPKARQARPK